MKPDTFQICGHFSELSAVFNDEDVCGCENTAGHVLEKCVFQIQMC